MKTYNVILIYNAVGDKILMCERRRPPYQGLRNLVGGNVLSFLPLLYGGMKNSGYMRRLLYQYCSGI